MTLKLRDIKWLKSTQLKSQVKGKDDDNYEIYISHLSLVESAWRAAIHGVAKSQTWLSNRTELKWLNWKFTGEFSWEFGRVEYFFGQQTWAQMSEGFKKIFSAQFCK